MGLSTATDDPVNGDAGKKSCFGLRDGRKFQVRCNEADVSFPIVSIGEASHQGNWFVSGPGCQAMLPCSSGELLRTCVQDPNAAKLEKHEECIGCHVRQRNARMEYRCAQIPEQQG